MKAAFYYHNRDTDDTSSDFGSLTDLLLDLGEEIDSVEAFEAKYRVMVREGNMHVELSNDDLLEKIEDILERKNGDWICSPTER